MNGLSKLKYAAIAFSLTALVSCTHAVKKVDLNSNDPQSILSSLNESLAKADTMQASVLAPDDFNKGRELLNEAKEELSESSPEMNDFKESASYSQAYLNRAIKKASKKQDVIGPIVKARMAAIKVGVRNYNTLSQRFDKVDEELKDSSANFKKELSADNFSRLQKRYLNLEMKAVQENEIGKARQLVEKSIENNAKYKAPKSLKQALTDLKTSENVISLNPRAPDEYKNSVVKTLRSSLYLNDVMSTIKSRGGNLKESVAIELVNNDKKLNKNNAELSTLKGHLDVAHSLVNGLEVAASVKDSRLNSAQEKISFQQAMNRARKSLSKNEAEVYQQGDKLIIRLKNINFSVGSSVVPESSRPLLNKVEKIITQVNAQNILVAGHTDATGSNTLNKRLSENRAKNVAGMLKTSYTSFNIDSVGYGPSKPLAANTTKEGRAKNRRVDIIVTAKK